MHNLNCKYPAENWIKKSKQKLIFGLNERISFLCALTFHVLWRLDTKHKKNYNTIFKLQADPSDLFGFNYAVFAAIL